MPTSPSLLPSAVLSGAADLIEPEGAWIQGHYAMTRFGRPIGPLEAPAACWCTVGALTNTACGDGPWQWWESRRYLERVIDRTGITDWNDAPERTQAEVVSALRQAATLARSEGA